MNAHVPRLRATLALATMAGLTLGYVMPNRAWADSAADTQAMTAGLPQVAQDALKLSRAGMSEDVVISQIKAAGGGGKLSTDQILFLMNSGVSQNVIRALTQAESAPNPAAVAAAPTLAPTPTPPPALPPEASDVVKLTKAGLGEDIILAQISGKTFPALTTDQLVSLNTAGVSSKVIKAMIAASSGAGSAPVANSQPAIYAQQPPAPPPMPAPAPAPVPFTLNVPSNMPWYDTGVDVVPGQLLTFNSGGVVQEASLIPFLRLSAGPSGVQGSATLPSFLAPELPPYSLIGRVGNSPAFEIGDSANIEAPTGGRLYMAANTNIFPSNKGSWVVSVTLGAAAPSAPPAQVSLAYFEQQLTPYGSWVQTAVGEAWIPAVAATAPGWMPYSDSGRWVYTDEGLFWQSDYAWGDVAFHYGRWYVDPSYGWAWVPGYDWAPAWVAWRHAEAEGFCGWAPLPPDAVFQAGIGLSWRGQVALDIDFGLAPDAWVFIGADHFWEHDYGRFYERGRFRDFYGRSVIHNGYRFEGGRFHVEGMGRERLGAFTHRDVRVEHDMRAREEHDHFAARHEDVRRVQIAHGVPSHDAQGRVVQGKAAAKPVAKPVAKAPAKPTPKP